MSNCYQEQIVVPKSTTNHKAQKLVLICLPGWRTSSAILRKQLEISRLKEVLDEYAGEYHRNCVESIEEFKLRLLASVIYNVEVH